MRALVIEHERTAPAGTRAEVPVLGICFAARLLAQALAFLDHVAGVNA